MFVDKDNKKNEEQQEKDYQYSGIKYIFKITLWKGKKN